MAKILHRPNIALAPVTKTNVRVDRSGPHIRVGLIVHVVHVGSQFRNRVQ